MNFRWAFAAVAIAASSATAFASNFEACVSGGQPKIWYTNPDVHRNRCSIGDNSLAIGAYWNGINQYNDLTNIVDDFLVRPASDCSSDHDDGMTEVGIADPASIDGNNGVTFVKHSTCVSSFSTIVEADIIINNTLSFTNKTGNFYGTSGRSTFVHEFGHFMGFKHEQSHGIMRTSPPHILTGGVPSSTIWPAETYGLNFAYGLTSSSPNLLPSAQGVSAGNVVLMTDGITTPCRNTVGSATFYVGNMGASATGTYTLRIRLTSAATSTGGTVVATFTHSLPAFSGDYYAFDFWIPSAFPFGDYYVLLDLDSTGSIAELREHDNTTVNGRIIRVQC